MQYHISSSAPPPASSAPAVAPITMPGDNISDLQADASFANVYVPYNPFPTAPNMSNLGTKMPCQQQVQISATASSFSHRHLRSGSTANIVSLPNSFPCWESSFRADGGLATLYDPFDPTSSLGGGLGFQLPSPASDSPSSLKSGHHMRASSVDNCAKPADLLSLMTDFPASAGPLESFGLFEPDPTLPTDIPPLEAEMFFQLPTPTTALSPAPSPTRKREHRRNESYVSVASVASLPGLVPDYIIEGNMLPFSDPGEPLTPHGPGMATFETDVLYQLPSPPALSSPIRSRRSGGHKRNESYASVASAASIAHINIEDTRKDTGIAPGRILEHIQGPNDAGKYLCTYEGCNKLFGRKENIKSHVQTHLDDRPYECPECKQRFVRQHDLKRHAKTHTGIKPYFCKCECRFARHDALTRHRQRGMCIGAFENVVRREAKRGRPRKPRPELDERMDKSARTREKNS